MNKKLTILGTALLLGAATSAFAASSTELTVTGTITPAACTPSLSGGGVVDFGKLSAKDLNATSATRLPPKTLQLTVSCDAPTQFAIIPIDNRAGSSAGPGSSTFGLGLINTDQRLGHYTLKFDNPIAGVASMLVASMDDGSTWFPHMGVATTSPNLWLALGSNGGSGWAPHDVEQATIDITVETQIARADSLTLTNEVNIDGSATLQIKYL
jgi:hypothetical protein